jgi:exonuclease III
MKSNVVWGDTLSPKVETVTRLYALNVNGLSLDKRGGQFDTLCSLIKETQADILCCQEHNIDTTNAQAKAILHTTVRNHWQRSCLTYGNSPIPFHSFYKPGGTMTITVNNLSGRVVEQTSDKWGRWVAHTYQGRNGKRLIVFNAYQVVQKPIKPGKITVASQQHSLLIQAVDPTTNPRTAFRRDLTKEIQNCREKGFAIILLGDFNEAFGSDPDGMVKIAMDNDLVNVMETWNSNSLPATYARGNKCIDYVLASPDILPAIVSAGYEPFNEKFHTDHRAYFIDFDTTLLFGSTTQHLSSLEPRIMSSTNITQVTQYIRKKYELLEQHNAFSRSQQLTREGNRHVYAERLDRDVTMASLTAEKSVKRYGEAEWSLELASLRHKVSILSKCLSMARNGIDLTRQIQHDLSGTAFDFELPSTIGECQTLLRETKMQVKQVVTNSYAQRTKERQDKLRALEASTKQADKKKARVLRHLRKAEDIKHLFRKIDHLRGRKVKRGVTRIEIPLHPHEDPKNCTEWQVVDVPTEILSSLQQRNQKHFSQAYGTPFTVPPLSLDLGYGGDTSSGTDILQGRYDVSTLPKSVATLIQHLRQTDEMYSEPVHPTITEQDFVGKLRVWRESTTTSPSGLHLGHYKALCARHRYSDIDDEDLTEDQVVEKQELNMMQQQLLELHLNLLNYALSRGYSYRRWQTIANTILFKDNDNVKIHRTRVIHIYEADFNLALGLKWRAAIFRSELSRVLNDGQYGSRPRRNAIDPVIIEELQMEISRASRKTFAQTNYDATSCYDRIVPNLAMLASRKFGVPKEVAAMNADTLRQAEYRIRTEVGLAPTGYSHATNHPVYGTGQGSANSPAIWCFISSLLFDCYSQVAYPATYCSPDSKCDVTLNMIGYVDDSNGQTNLFRANDPSATITDTILMQVRHNAQNWANILGASGGAIEIPKCSCHIMEWNFSIQGAPVLSPRRVTEITINEQVSGNSSSSALPVLSSYSAHKTLGHLKEPVGNQLAQFRALLKKSNDSVSFLWKCPLPREEAWTFYFACYLPSVCYPLSCSSITKKQLDKVQRHAMSIIIPRCGFNRHTKREILYGPLSHGGANFRSLYVEQGIGQLKLFMRHWRLQTTTGKLFRVALSWFQLAVGVSHSILEQPHALLPHLESKWLASLRTFMSINDITLQLDDPMIPPLQRVHDAHIMDIVLQSKKYTASEIRRINYCRLFLQAVTLSDLATVDGQYVDASKLKGHPSLRSSSTTLMHINQDRPSESEWSLWKKVNHLWSNEDGRFHQSLGRWLLPIHKQREQHFAYLLSNHQLVVKTTDNYRVCQRISTTMFQETSYRLPFHSVDPQAVPAAVKPSGTSQWKLHSPTQILASPIPHFVSPSATFDDYLKSLDPWEFDLLNHIELAADPYAVCHDLSYGIRGASDGSVKYEEHGAYGWVLSTDRGVRLVFGKGPVRGYHPTSFRAEGVGLLSLLRFLIRIAQYTMMHEPWSGTVVTDSKSLLDVLFGTDDTTDNEQPPPQLPYLEPTQADWDVLVELRHSLERLPGITLRHIKGHQDRKVPYPRLPLLAQLNVDADRLASQFQEEHGCSRPHVLLSPRARVQMTLANKGTITSALEHIIRHVTGLQPLWNYIKNKHEWSDHTMESVNWKAHGQSLRRKVKQRTHYIKLVNGILPTNSVLHRKDSVRCLCPSCHTAKEDWTHVLRCSHPQRSRWRQYFLRALHDFCVRERTCPNLQELLLEVARSWLHAPVIEGFTVEAVLHHPTLLRLITQQSLIGWQEMFRGRFSSEWARRQDEYYWQHREELPHSKMSGQSWQVKLICKIWELWMEVWKIRNQALHGYDDRTRNEAERREIFRTLEEIYRNRHDFEPSVQGLLHPTIEAHRQEPLWVTRNWISTNRGLMQESMRRVRTMALRGVRSIRTYFHSMPP